MRTILALDLGKLKTLSCLLTKDHASIAVFKTNMTHRKTFMSARQPNLFFLNAWPACG